MKPKFPLGEIVAMSGSKDFKHAALVIFNLEGQAQRVTRIDLAGNAVDRILGNHFHSVDREAANEGWKSRGCVRCSGCR